MVIREKIFDELSNIALLSDHAWARVSSALVYKGRIISYGINRNKSHTFQWKYSSNPMSIYFHSETHCIKTALQKGFDIDDFRRSDLYVCRIKCEEHNPKKLIKALAKPCIGCYKCIKEFDIRSVIYTINNNEYGII